MKALPDLVPPEIENLRDCATRPDGGSLTQFEAFIPLADAEAAVLACEQRIREERYEADVIGPARAFARDYRQRTVAEIVDALREHAAHLGNVEGRYYASAANYVEQRFGAKKEGDGNRVAE